MMQTISELFSAVFQVIICTLIPFFFFLFRKDKSQTFSEYIGFYKPGSQSILYACGVALIFVAMGLGLVFINAGFRQVALSPASVTGKIRSIGFNTAGIISLLIMALIKTSLSEELFFRGFIAKRLVNKFGFKTGNIIQAVIFGLLHLLLARALVKVTFWGVVPIFILSSFAGWAIGYVKERYARGSIIPGWVAHGLGNTISYFIIAFVI